MNLKLKKKSDTYDNYFSDESHPETIDYVAPDELLGNSTSLKPFHVDFDNGNEADTLQKKNTETSHIAHVSSVLLTK